MQEQLRSIAHLFWKPFQHRHVKLPWKDPVDGFLKASCSRLAWGVRPLVCCVSKAWLLCLQIGRTRHTLRITDEGSGGIFVNNSGLSH